MKKKLKFMTMSEIDKLRQRADIAQFIGDYETEQNLRHQIKLQVKFWHATETNRKKSLQKLIDSLSESTQLNLFEH